MTVTKGSLASKIRQDPQRIVEVSLAVLGILLFAGTIHRALPVRLMAFCGLAGTAAMIAYSTRGQGLLEAFALKRFGKKTLLYILPGIVLGVVLGILSRNRFEISLFPARMTGVALVAPLVGAMEEIIFRGFIQGHLRPIGRVFSVVYASAVHTSYKLLVILTLSLPLQFDFFFLMFWTFVGGLLIGTLRELSGSSLPSMTAHAVFDVILYGGLATFPVWVWA